MSSSQLVGDINSAQMVALHQMFLFSEKEKWLHFFNPMLKNYDLCSCSSYIAVPILISVTSCPFRGFLDCISSTSRVEKTPLS